MFDLTSDVINLVEDGYTDEEKKEAYDNAVALSKQMENAEEDLTPITYYEVAINHSMPEHKAKRFVAYMKSRWPNEEAINCRTGYSDEWADRFTSGYEYEASDLQGQMVLNELDK